MTNNFDCKNGTGALSSTFGVHFKCPQHILFSVIFTVIKI